MPIYEYQCECGNKQEVMLPVQDRNQPQTCSVCGKVMERKLSIPQPVIMKQTGRDMAISSLNSRGGGLPNGRFKASTQQAAAAGLDYVKPVIGKGF